MRVCPIGAPVLYNRNCVVRKNNTHSAPQTTIPFKGLKFGDYLAGAICGGAMAAVGFAIAGPIGAIAMGAWGAKTTAEANYETRKDDD